MSLMSEKRKARLCARLREKAKKREHANRSAAALDREAKLRAEREALREKMQQVAAGLKMKETKCSK